MRPNAPEKLIVQQVPIEELRERLKQLEQQHQMASETFYTKALAGQLPEHPDFLDWLGYWETYQSLASHDAA